MDDYYFSKILDCVGWATWKSSWNKLIKKFNLNEVLDNKQFENYFNTNEEIKWPDYNKSILDNEEVKFVIQING